MHTPLAHPSADADQPLQFWRTQLLNGVLTGIAVLGLPAVIAGIYAEWMYPLHNRWSDG